MGKLKLLVLLPLLFLTSCKETHYGRLVENNGSQYGFYDTLHYSSPMENVIKLRVLRDNNVNNRYLDIVYVKKTCKNYELLNDYLKYVLKISYELDSTFNLYFSTNIEIWGVK